MGAAEDLACKPLKCHDLCVKTKAVRVDAKVEPIINPKTKAPKVGFSKWPPKQHNKAA